MWRLILLRLFALYGFYDLWYMRLWPWLEPQAWVQWCASVWWLWYLAGVAMVVWIAMLNGRERR